MVEEKFNVYMNDVMTAENMTLETAIIVVKGLFNEYYKEAGLKITIQKVK